ncbi:MAG TPA: sialidase family protein, partial [Candidatus Thermoplasmatota archaeon]|nr:sialidase family protein [Candidatus Thermoplasmatota archaeon]
LTPDFDPDLAVDVDGTVWFDTLWLGCSSAASSRDGGKTWTTSPLACVPPAGDRQYLIPTKGGTAYIYAHSLPTFYQMVAKTTDHGATWTPLGSAEGVGHHLLLTGGSGWGGGGFWNPATDSVFLTYTWFEGDAWSPAASVTRDGGRTWEVVKAETMGGDGVGLSLVVGAADHAGNVYLAWAESHADGKDMAVYLASSADDGRTWSKPKRVDDGTGSKVFPSIAALAPGKVAVAYYEADEAAYPARVAKTTGWNVTLAWTADALADAPAWERATLSDGTARHGPICPDGTSCQGNRQLLDYFALKATPDGRVASVWTSTDDVEGRTLNVFAATERALLASG